MIRKFVLTLVASLLAACGPVTGTESPYAGVDPDLQVEFAQRDIAHTNITMLVPGGWVSDYYQGTTRLASDGDNFFYSPSEPFEGVLIELFLSDGPRAVGPSFDVLKLAQDFVADQPDLRQPPVLNEDSGRQIVTTRYVNDDSKGKPITYFVGFVQENQQLTVFLAATPNDTEETFLPILEAMLFSIQIQSPA